MKKLLFTCSLLTIVFVTNAQTTDNLKVVDSTTTFKGLSQPLENGSLIKTANFHFYEINDKVIQKAGYPAIPQITVYQDGKKYKMKIQGMEKVLTVKKIQEVIETNIVGYLDDKDVRDFKGYDGTTTFRLLNGQDWKQDETTSNVFSNLFRPAVTIYLASEGYKMKIEGLNESPILVKKVK
jgi:hypothetical protein